VRNVGNINWSQVKQDVSAFVRTNQPEVLALAVKVVQTIIIIVISFLIIRFGSIAIKKFFERQKEFKYKLDTKRTDTLSALCISILRYSIYFIAGVTILQSVFGINATTLITAAGVGGLAIGFGAQSLVKDVITGFFILLEDQFSVGDSITVENMSGIVEEIGLRITKIRNYTGDLYIIPNSEIRKVTNHTRGAKAAIVDISVAYEENIDRVTNILNSLCKACADEMKDIVEGPTVLGITELADSGIVMRIFAKTTAGKQGEIEREIRKRIKVTFEQEGIEIPYNKLVVIKDHTEVGGG